MRKKTAIPEEYGNSIRIALIMVYGCASSVIEDADAAETCLENGDMKGLRENLDDLKLKVGLLNKHHNALREMTKETKI